MLRLRKLLLLMRALTMPRKLRIPGTPLRAGIAKEKVKSSNRARREVLISTQRRLSNNKKKSERMLSVKSSRASVLSALR